MYHLYRGKSASVPRTYGSSYKCWYVSRSVNQWGQCIESDIIKIAVYKWNLLGAFYSNCGEKDEWNLEQSFEGSNRDLWKTSRWEFEKTNQRSLLRRGAVFNCHCITVSTFVQCGLHHLSLWHYMHGPSPLGTKLKRIHSPSTIHAFKNGFNWPLRSWHCI